MAGFLCSLVSMVPPLGLLMLLRGLVAEWSPSDEFDEAGAASSVPDHPNVWSDGGLVLDRVTGVSSSGAGFFAHQPEDYWGGRRWGDVDHVRLERGVQSCRGFLLRFWASPVCSES